MMATTPTPSIGPTYKLLTHIFAVVIAGIASFAVTPAGIALIKQYPHLSVVAGAVTMLATLYHTPKED